MIYYYDNEFRSGSISLDVTSPALRFGAGFFETIFYNGSQICHLQKHIRRITGSLDHYAIQYMDLDFMVLIQEVIQKNGLAKETARINIYYVLEADNSPAVPMIAAYLYKVDPDKVYRLAISPYIHDSHLCAHKSMNYMHYFLAKRAAVMNGFDDATLLDKFGSIREATTASIVFSDGNGFFAPEVENQFPSIALEVAGTVLTIRNVVQISSKSARDSSEGISIEEFKYAYMLNSLIGMKPISQIGDIAFEVDAESCEQVTQKVLCRQQS